MGRLQRTGECSGHDSSWLYPWGSPCRRVTGQTVRSRHSVAERNCWCWGSVCWPCRGRRIWSGLRPRAWREWTGAGGSRAAGIRVRGLRRWSCAANRRAPSRSGAVRQRCRCVGCRSTAPAGSASGRILPAEPARSDLRQCGRQSLCRLRSLRLRRPRASLFRPDRWPEPLRKLRKRDVYSVSRLRRTEARAISEVRGLRGEA